MDRMDRDNITSSSTSSYSEISQRLDAGLREYMLKVFSYMAGGLAMTAVVAFFASSSAGFMQFLFSSRLCYWGVIIAPLVVAICLMTRISKISPDTARMLFFTYAALVGLSLSSIFLIYSPKSITTTFFVTSSMFLSMVVYGYSTNKDLTSWGSFLMMGLIGLIIASVVNMFMNNGTASLVISGIGVVIFTGLTAYDSQVIKSYYTESEESELTEKKAVLGALNLYLDFINLFLYLLRFLGDRR